MRGRARLLESIETRGEGVIHASQSLQGYVERRVRAMIEHDLPEGDMEVYGLSRR